MISSLECWSVCVSKSLTRYPHQPSLFSGSSKLYFPPWAQTTSLLPCWESRKGLCRFQAAEYPPSVLLLWEWNIDLQHRWLAILQTWNWRVLQWDNRPLPFWRLSVWWRYLQWHHRKLSDQRLWLWHSGRGTWLGCLVCVHNEWKFQHDRMRFSKGVDNSHVFFGERRQVLLAKNALEGNDYLLSLHVFIILQVQSNKTPYCTLFLHSIVCVTLSVMSIWLLWGSVACQWFLTSNMFLSWRLLWALSACSLHILASVSASHWYEHLTWIDWKVVMISYLQLCDHISTWSCPYLGIRG